ncbi:MAG: helix-turn-helix transcriptional regulator [Clostridia bacterium]|nr:helix-turn-helix transcriptional regulator [Clostridia bacterium]
MLNEKIKSLRLSCNYSQVDVAEKLSVTKQTISNWENNNIQPSIDMLIKIADLFGVTTDYLLSRESIARIDVNGLTDTEVQHINNIINDLRRKSK